MARLDDHRARRREIESLLDDLDARRRRLLRLSASGVRRGGMRDAKRDLSAARSRLSAVLDVVV